MAGPSGTRNRPARKPQRGRRQPQEPNQRHEPHQVGRGRPQQAGQQHFRHHYRVS